MTFSVLGFFCIGWYELKYNLNLVISTNKDKIRFSTAVTWYGISLGHKMSWGKHLTTGQHDQKPDQISTWPKAWSLGGGTCDPYYFYIQLKLWRLISLSILIFFTYVLSRNAWNRLLVKWNGMADEPYPQGRNFIDMLQKYFLSTFYSLPLQLFFNIVKVSGIESHLKFTFLYHFYIHVKLLEGYISLNINIFLHIFVWECLRRRLYLLNTYNVSSAYFSGVQESIICVVHRSQILSDVKY